MHKNEFYWHHKEQTVIQNQAKLLMFICQNEGLHKGYAKQTIFQTYFQDL
jgi:uncharacterized damage-inducible protein DinB